MFLESWEKSLTWAARSEWWARYARLSPGGWLPQADRGHVATVAVHIFARVLVMIFGGGSGRAGLEGWECVGGEKGEEEGCHPSTPMLGSVQRPAAAAPRERDRGGSWVCPLRTSR